MIGSITLLFCLIRLSIWSLFHKNNARSATWTRIDAISYYSSVNYMFCIAISIGLNKIGSLWCLMVWNTTVDLKCNERSPSQYFVPELHSIFVHRSVKDNNCG
jgi:hypothetical protein